MSCRGFSSEALDRHITGNYGEDQYRGQEICEECEHGMEENCGKHPLACLGEAKENAMIEKAEIARDLREGRFDD